MGSVKTILSSLIYIWNDALFFLSQSFVNANGPLARSRDTASSRHLPLLLGAFCNHLLFQCFLKGPAFTSDSHWK